MKKSYISQAATELTVGFFVFAILGALILFTIVLSYDNIFTKSFEMQVRFDNVTGLIRGDKVYVQGVDVGRVSELAIGPEGVDVKLTLKYRVQLREDYQIQVKPSSVLGGKYVSIYEGTRDGPLLSADAVIVGRAPVDFLEEASEALTAIRGSLEEGGILGNLEATLANLKSVTEGLEKGEGTIGKLLKDDAVYVELKDVATNLKTITDRLAGGEGSIGKLLTEETVYDDLKQVAADLKEISGRLSRGEGTIGKLLSADETIYNDLKGTLASINDAMAKVSRGEGTLGRLVNDDALYNEIMKALAEIRAMFDDLRETSPVTTMTSIFFGAF
ncbi:MAG TPA: MlaD family protein [Kiritimatiellia bacterium]|nr:MlaD family protein [Kiritimatiellia bacterium]HMO97819.1 MlaD family protein [Kiritimatiellia bacterium]HMP96434.1 MlaD family protein [Kiritimatiellia bacterium]